jgi:uncharacterized protein
MVVAQLYQKRFLAIRLPIVVLALIIASLTWQLLFPIAPARLRFSAGAPGGGYSRDANLYAQWLERWGISTEVMQSNGSLENIERLSKGQADLAFAQGGFGFTSISSAQAPTENIVTLANVGVEHFWVFSNQAGIESVAQLRGLRIGVAGPGSGTRRLLQELLTLWRLEPKDYTLTTLSAQEMPAALQQGRVDVVVQVAAASSPLIQAMLAQQGIALAYLKRTAAIYERLPYLHPQLILRGSLTEKRTQPEQDLTLMSVRTSLIAHSGLDPALQRLLTYAAQQQAESNAINPFADNTPRLKQLDFPSSSHARYVLESGLPWWEQNLPYFWAQVLVRMVLIVLPIALLAAWLCMWLPTLLRWRLESQINRWYGELRFIEHELGQAQVAGIDVARYMARLSALDASMSRFKTPRALLPRWQLLRLYVNFVRQGLLQLRGR